MSKFSRELTSAELAEIAKLPAADQGLAFILLSENRGKKIENLKAFLAAVRAREEHPTAFISLDERSEDDFSFCEKIAAADPQEVLDAMREQHKVEQFDDDTEQVLDVSRKTAPVLAKLAKCSIRKVKYSRAKLINEYSGASMQIPLFQAEIEGVAI